MTRCSQRPAAKFPLCIYSAALIWLALGVAPIAAFPAAKGVAATDGYVAELWADNLSKVRSLLYDQEANQVLALLSGTSQVVALKESSDGSTVTRKVLVESPDRLTHGLAVHNGYLYASSADVVYRWPYNPSQGTISNAEAEPVVNNIGKISKSDTAAGHITRTIVFDNSSRLYISVGSNWNVDPTSFRSRIRRVDLSGPVPNGGHDFLEAEVFADGLRNEVGLTFDSRGRLWGVENGADRLQRYDLGTDIYQTNPAEEINLFDGPPGTHYGYPWCFSAYNLPDPNNQSNVQYLEQFYWPQDQPSNHPDFREKDDDWCRDPNNNRPPVMGLPAHTAPLGIHFYNATGCEEQDAFECWMKGDAFIALHGSWNRDVPDGYKVVRVPFTAAGMPDQTMEPIVWQTDYEDQCITDEQKASCFRPVHAIFLSNGKMLVSSDTTGEIILVRRNTSVVFDIPPGRTPPPASPPPSPSPPHSPSPVVLSPPPAAPLPSTSDEPSPVAPPVASAIGRPKRIGGILSPEDSQAAVDNTTTASLAAPSAVNVFGVMQMCLLSACVALLTT